MLSERLREIRRIVAGLLISVATMFLLNSCDGAARVTGTVVSVSGEEMGPCSFELFFKDDNTLVHSREITGDFDVDFTVSPFENEYYMVIRCKDCVSYHKTDTYSIGGAKYFEDPIDLGTIVMTGEKNEQGGDHL